MITKPFQQKNVATKKQLSVAHELFIVRNGEFGNVKGILVFQLPVVLDEVMKRVAVILFLIFVVLLQIQRCTECRKAV